MRFDPSVGSEIQKTRPALIVSATPFNGRTKLTMLPLTSREPNNPKMLSVLVAVEPSLQNGLKQKSYVIGIDPATFDKQRLVQYLGQLEADPLRRVQRILQLYLGLGP
ncbi:type II toxin-antitoxin system PemK/MazF family toxin [Gloeobacter violaceus]|uniref:Glr4050 protein n=1 Tax=Gloeobacter violaceus (strain ATCC 29082 / PCC 7421) TaxID=251221 RepID=Q7NE30_GLOVI|nr:type II toxin-antitoxin system PemK/MazF family toxin [Gloeobacter violaceus]BAC91991.1 glr4050 [Gloeobacter violaceus PCC 7421]